MSAVANSKQPATAPTAPSLCWICKVNPADSGEHKTKRSDLLDVLGRPTQDAPFFYHDLHQPNRPVGSLDAKILKSPVRICKSCNNARTQPHDLAWEEMSKKLRSSRLKIGSWLRLDRIFQYDAKSKAKNVHLYFIKLFGCMLAEAKANGYDLPVDLDGFSSAIMQDRPHPEVHLQFGRHDGGIGRSNLHCWTTDPGKSVLAAWLYELDTVAVNVQFVQAGRFEHRVDLWHPKSSTSSKRLNIADFMYARQMAKADGKIGKAEAVLNAATAI